MGTARERKLWDLGLGKAPFPSPGRELGLRGRTMNVASPCTKLCVYPTPGWRHILVHPREHPGDVMLRSWTRADLHSRSRVILASLGSGHLATVHPIARQP